MQFQVAADGWEKYRFHVDETVFPVSRLHVADPEGLVEAIRGSELDPWLLSGHRTDSGLSRIMLPESCLDQVEIGPAMWFRGVMPKDCYTLVYITACPEEGQSFNFSSRHRDRCLGFFAPGGILDAKTPPGYRHATLTIPEAVFHKALECRQQVISEKLLKQGGSFFPQETACRSIETVLDAMQETLRSAPDTLAIKTARESLAGEIHDRFLDLIRSDGGCEVTNARTTRRYQRLRLVREFIAENSHRPIRLHELCHVSGLSRRGLEYLFVDLLGVRVSAFLMQQRLHGVRRDLLAAEPRHGLVKQCALNWGFWHLGRFAAEYRALFGENPNAVLRRRTTDNPLVGMGDMQS